MSIVFFLLALLTIIALIIGLIRPKTIILWGTNEKKTRKRVLLYYGLAVLVFFVAFVATVPALSPEEKAAMAMEREVVQTKKETENKEKAKKEAEDKDKKDAVEKAKVEEKTKKESDAKVKADEKAMKDADAKPKAEADAKAEADTGTKGYYPVEKILEMTTTDGKGGNWIKKNLGKKTIEGKDVFAISSKPKNSSDVTTSLYIYNENNDVQLVGKINSKEEVKWEKEPKVILLGKMVPNKEYTVKDDIFEKKMVLKGFESVELSGRKFENCMVVETSQTINKSIIKTKAYYYKDLGIVKYEFAQDSSSTQEYYTDSKD
ncbi:hypothetical protein SAMN03159341_101425 [Paenibacillus sp. 1_12]|nr:hypothetical protein SAMN03159341_101425 [Paenibacillus sp. 1_12]